MTKINFENADILQPAKVTVNGTDYTVTPAVISEVDNYLSPETLNALQDNMEQAILTPQTTKTETDTDVYSCNYINQITEKNSICMNIDSVSQDLTVGAIIPFDNITTQIGNKLSLVNNAVKIGAGITKIKISALIWTNSPNRNYYKLFHKRGNTTTLLTPYIGKSGADGFTSIAIANFQVNVQENDIVYINSAMDNTVQLNKGSDCKTATYMTVEAI